MARPQKLATACTHLVTAALDVQTKARVDAYAATHGVSASAAIAALANLGFESLRAAPQAGEPVLIAHPDGIELRARFALDERGAIALAHTHSFIREIS